VHGRACVGSRLLFFLSSFSCLFPVPLHRPHGVLRPSSPCFFMQSGVERLCESDNIHTSTLRLGPLLHCTAGLSFFNPVVMAMFAPSPPVPFGGHRCFIFGGSGASPLFPVLEWELVCEPKLGGACLVFSIYLYFGSVMIVSTYCP